MESRDFVYLQEAYQEIYQLDEEVEVATEYFYEMGLDKGDVEGLIEELGVNGFNDYVCEILEEYGITNISEAAKWQDRLARGVLNAMERDRKAREQFGKTKVGKALSNIGSKAAAGLTAIGDVGEKVVSAAEKATRPRTKTSTRAALPPAGQTSGSSHLTGEPMTADERAIRNRNSPEHKRALAKLTQKVAARGSKGSRTIHVGPSSRSTSSKTTERQRPALPPVGTTKAGKPLTSSQRKMQTDAQNKRLKKRLGLPEEFEAWVEGLWEDGYDLSDYTWEGLYEAYIEEVSGYGRVDPMTGNYINRSLPQDRPNRSAHGSSAHLNMTPLKRAEARSKALRARDNTAATRRANKIDKFVRNATDSAVDSFRAASQARRDERKRLMDTQESYEAYNTIADYLLDEGYAHDLESADAIIASMSEDWIVDILEAEKVFPLRKVADKMRKVSKKLKSTPSPEEQERLRKRLNKMGDEYWQPN